MRFPLYNCVFKTMKAKHVDIYLVGLLSTWFACFEIRVMSKINLPAYAHIYIRGERKREGHLRWFCSREHSGQRQVICATPADNVSHKSDRTNQIWGAQIGLHLPGYSGSDLCVPDLPKFFLTSLGSAQWTSDVRVISVIMYLLISDKIRLCSPCLFEISVYWSFTFISKW